MTSDSAAPVKSEPDPNTIRHIVRHQDRYWSQMGLFILATSIIVLGTGGIVKLVYVLYNLALPHDSHAPFADLIISVSPDSALAAFGILATLIVALQVAVRSSTQLRTELYTPEDRHTEAAALARQTALEALARLSGLAAIALGLATTLSSTPWQPSQFDPIHLLGPTLGGILLALIAGDASTASADRLRRSIIDERERRERHRLRNNRRRWMNHTDGQTPSGYMTTASASQQPALSVTSVPLSVTRH